MYTKKLELYIDTTQETFFIPTGKMTFFDEFYVDFQVTPTVGLVNGVRCQVTIHPKQDIILKNVRLEYNEFLTKNDRVFCNGFQSWSESTERKFGESFDRVNWAFRQLQGYFGDDHYTQIQRGKKHLHSWTYGYVRQAQNHLLFIGSITESTGFTLIQYTENSETISIEKDCEGLELKHSFPIMDVWIGEGKEKDVFEHWFDLQDLPPLNVRPATGWTSWYYHYTNISEAVILKNLDAFAKKAAPIDIFQIDDGWQTHIGDWLTIKDNFPKGMAALSHLIHSKGYSAGLWLAPMICERDSDIFKNKKHWLVQNEKGDLLKVGHMPHWSGWFYALDFYKKEVQDYLTQVFHTVLEHWGFDMVKLDFLFAACILPRPHKTRGQIMYDVMTFLRDISGDKIILGCGVPLGAAFGQVDYCRIGADIDLKWSNPLFKFLGHRERVSTIASLHSTIHRWQLNRRVFYNDPDVFILRDKKQKLNPTQQNTVLLINTLLGSLLFISDDLDDYTVEQYSEYQQSFKWKGSIIQHVEQVKKEVYTIHFEQEDQNYQAVCNLTGKSVSISKQIQLDAYETLILKV